MMSVCTKLNQVFLYTDGSCLNNPGPGGYAAILQSGAYEKVLTGGVAHTTNNRMEMQAVIAGLAALKRCCQACPEQRRRVMVVTDSQYVATILKACTEPGRSGGNARVNHDLVQQVRALAAGHHLSVQVVAGHSGHALNERCDALAQAVARQQVV